MLSQLVLPYWVLGVAFVVLAWAFIAQRKRERAAGGNRTVKELLKNIWHNGAGSPSYADPLPAGAITSPEPIAGNDQKLGYGLVAVLAAMGAIAIIYPFFADAGATGVPLGLILLFLAWLAWRAVKAGRAKIVLISAAGGVAVGVISFLFRAATH